MIIGYSESKSAHEYVNLGKLIINFAIDSMSVAEQLTHIVPHELATWKVSHELIINIELMNKSFSFCGPLCPLIFRSCITLT